LRLTNGRARGGRLDAETAERLMATEFAEMRARLKTG
jgi:hypothetical protein